MRGRCKGYIASFCAAPRQRRLKEFKRSALGWGARLFYYFSSSPSQSQWQSGSLLRCRCATLFVPFGSARLLAGAGRDPWRRTRPSIPSSSSSLPARRCTHCTTATTQPVCAATSLAPAPGAAASRPPARPSSAPAPLVLVLVFVFVRRQLARPALPSPPFPLCVHLRPDSRACAPAPSFASPPTSPPYHLRLLYQTPTSHFNGHRIAIRASHPHCGTSLIRISHNLCAKLRLPTRQARDFLHRHARRQLFLAGRIALAAACAYSTHVLP